ncbi:hypothetical protein LPTSP2_39020 [Leptospira ellinghausenii]|uniref:Outer membrane protein n=1 Tax=Leptospira ellinghausenii TaxID=1917822 RepID=A0A2P2DJ24_9LEPT|nr:hypothetical protein [Leptospira ellinghausenii]GBF44599.1 hypothetical protein LPTSP2_39020 [Leptospira ellinghausenii]
MNKKKIILLFSIIIPFSGIFSEPQRYGLFLEAIYGKPISFPHTNPNKVSGDFYSNRKGTVDTLGYFVRTFGNENEYLLSTYAFRNADKPKLSGENYSILIEYVFKSNFGLGFSINQNKYNLENLSIDKFQGNLLLNIYSVLNPEKALSVQERTNLEILSPYLQFDIRNYFILNTASINFSYHFLKYSNFDPYIRIHGGYGSKSNSQPTIIQYGLSLGSRYFISDNFYLMSDIQFNKSDAIYDASSFFGNGGGQTIRWSINEVNVRFGTGLNVW